ncbi:MAG: hypothetical protein LUH55_13650 [Bacteroides thetaiotaomicron]|nr:hypothetical protein [Bacteroides thetaiotaomicron]
MDVKVTPSARAEIDVLEIAEKLVREDFYANDYINSTLKLISDDIPYDMVKNNYLELMKMIFV